MSTFLTDHVTDFRLLHVSMVAATACLMVLRLYLSLRQRDYRDWRLLRILPHAIDTLLLVSAALLAIGTQQYPFIQPWLSAKVIALCFYIMCGAAALDPARPATSRKLASLMALLLLGYIVAVAITRNPLICI